MDKKELTLEDGIKGIVKIKEKIAEINDKLNEKSKEYCDERLKAKESIRTYVKGIDGRLDIFFTSDGDIHFCYKIDERKYLLAILKQHYHFYDTKLTVDLEGMFGESDKQILGVCCELIQKLVEVQDKIYHYVNEACKKFLEIEYEIRSFSKKRDDLEYTVRSIRGKIGI